MDRYTHRSALEMMSDNREKKTNQGMAVVTAVKKQSGDLSDLGMHQDREEVEEIVIYVGAAGAAELYTSTCIRIRIGGCMPGPGSPSV